MPGDQLATPDQYGKSLQGAPVLSSEQAGWRSGLVRRWTNVSGDIRQPPIDHHYLVLHLGGPKRVTRAGGGRTVSTPVEAGALTLVPAGTRYDWVTVGPIDFAHLYVHPSRLSSLIALKFDRDPSSVTLDERIGFEDPLLSQTMRQMLAEVGHATSASGAYLDSLFDLTVAHLAHKHSTLGRPKTSKMQALTPLRLRRAIDYVEAHIAEPISLDDLAGAAELSRFHFGRSFHNAMGEPPLTYVMRRRLEMAKRLLRTSVRPLAEIARSTGLGTPSQFAANFRRHAGQTPSSYRRQL
jgi:AraC family transcriptional regulator